MVKSWIARFVHDENGATAIEYGLLAGLISIALVFGFTMVGNGVSNLFNNGNAEVLEAQAAKIPR